MTNHKRRNLYRGLRFPPVGQAAKESEKGEEEAQSYRWVST